MDGIESQLTIRNKCEQLQKTMKELYDWEAQIKQTSSAKANPADGIESHRLPPVRSDVKAMGKFSEDKASAEKQDHTEGETVNKKQLADAETLKERGNKQCKLGNFQEAIELYNEAIATYSENATYYCNRAYCYMNLERFDDCLADCATAIEKDPQYIKAYHRRMQAYERLGENGKAAAECRQILSRSRDEYELNTTKRDLARIEKRLEGQKPVFSPVSKPTATVLDPTLALVKQEADKYKELGNKHLARKDFGKAERSYTKAISLFGDEPIYYNNRSLCHWNLKDYDQCLADCNKAIRLDENYFRPYYRRMQVRELRGAYLSAVEDCRKFIELTTDDKQKATAEKDLLRLEKLVKSEQPAKQAFVWSEIKKNAKLSRFIQKPPHLRSKKPLKRIPIVDVGPVPSVPVVTKDLPAPGKRQNIPDAVIDKMFNNNTGERLIEPEEKTNLEHLFPSGSNKLRNMFSPPATPTEQKKPFVPPSNSSMAVVPATVSSAPVVTNSSKVPEMKSPVQTVGEQQSLSHNKVEKEKINQGNLELCGKDSKMDPAKKNSSPLPVVVQQTTQPLSVPTMPKSSAQFYTTWSGLNEDLRYQYLKLLDGHASLHKLFGASLSNEMLTELLYILRKRFIPDRVEVTHIMKELAQNESIGILSLLTNKDDRNAITELLKYMEANGAQKHDVDTVRRKLIS